MTMTEICKTLSQGTVLMTTFCKEYDFLERQLRIRSHPQYSEKTLLAVASPC